MKNRYPFYLFSFFLFSCLNAIAQPVANFTANRFSGCSPLTVQFTSTSTGNPTSYLWNFGNGNTSTLQNPSAIYVNPGTYNVTLTVSNGSITNTKVVNAYITVYNNPVANFSATPVSGCAPLSVSFTDITTIGGGAISSWLWDFGGGVTSTQRNPTNVYNLPGTYTVTLIVTDVNGCQSTKSQPAYINVTAPFTVNFSASPTAACAPPLNTTFTSTVSPAGTYTYAWNFGNSNTSTAQNPTQTYTSNGNYTVELEVTSASGCKRKVTQNNLIQIGGITADFDITQSGICAPATITCSNKSSPASSGNTFTWTSIYPNQTGANATYQYLAPGTHSITLTARSAAGCTSSVSKSFTLAQKPTANFTVSKSNFCETPAVVSFTNTSLGASVTNWNFSNGFTSTTANPTTTYNAEGTFSPRLIVIGPQGSNCRDTVFGTIKIGKPNVEILSQNSKSGCAPLLVNFEAIDRSLIPLTNWKWELNGVTISTNRVFSRTFPDTGKYVLKLTATNSDSCEVVLFDEVNVGMKPVIDFTADKLSGCYNRTTVNFTPTWGAVKPDLMLWNMDNKITSNVFFPQITFTDTGVYTITLNASHKGCTTEVKKEDYITIFPPIAVYNYIIDSCKTDSVKFIQRSAGRNRYVWDFGDSTTSVLAAPDKFYTKPGTYNVKMIAQDTVSNCYDTLVKSIIIITKPQLKFTPTDTAGCGPFRLQLNDASVLDSSRIIRKWTWTFTPGNIIIAGKNPIVNLTNQGMYHVKLEVSDDKSCVYSAIDSNAIKVYRGSANFTTSVTKGCAPLLVVVRDTARSENGILNRKWLWGNGDSVIVVDTFASYTFQNPNPTNQSAGFFIRLLVTDSLGCTFTSTRNIIPSKPVVSFSETVTKTCGKDSFRFNSILNASTFLGPGSALWQFPNNTQAIGFAASYTASGDTTLPFKLTFTDANGCRDSSVKQLKVNTKQPLIQFNATPRNIPCYKSNTKVKFNDETIIGGSGIRFRRWTFGDSTGADSFPSPEKVYFKPGRYPVSLTVSDSAGCQGTVQVPDFIIVGGPLGTYSFTPKNGCSPTEVFFDVNSPNARLIIWDHADGDVDTFSVDTHRYVYSRPGVYYPRLTLIDSSLTCDFGYDATDSIVVTPLPAPNFTADRTLICKGTFVTLTNTTPSHTSAIVKWKWLMGSGDSILQQGPVIYAYDRDGKFSVSLQATDTLGCVGTMVKDSFLTVNDDTIPPAIPLVKRATVMSNDSVLFEYFPSAEIDFAKYLIYHQTFTTQKQDRSDTTFYETGVNTTEFPYQYEMAAVDVCNNQSAMSELHRTIELKTYSAINAIDLLWTNYLGFDTSYYYEIWRKGLNDTGYTLLATLPADSIYYKDTSVLCYAYYNYRIKAVETDSNFQYSWSDTSGAAPIYLNTLPFTQNIRATVVGSVVRLEWNLRKHNRSFSYHIYRAVDDNIPTYYKTIKSTDTVLIDVEVDVNSHTYTYVTYLIDSCGGMSQPSNMARSILLKVRMIGNDILTHDPKLNWTPYAKWENGVNHYNALFYNQVENKVDLVSRNDTFTFETRHRYINLAQDEYCYIITAYKWGDTSIISESNRACVSTEPRLFAPNVFTVNNDNLNDVFYVRGLFINTFELKIFDRWGKKVFETNNINDGWNGMVNGEPAATDVYTYTAEATGKQGQRVSISGNITLMR